MPLPGDPTKEQIKEIKEQQKNREAEEALKILAMYETLGLINKSIN